MDRDQKCKVFISYSRHDEALVKPLAGLLGVAADDEVFLDVAALKPGDPWEVMILRAIKQCSVFIICWCCQAKHSEFVMKEISAALGDQEKKLVPVLFCSAKLPDSIAGRQWIDLRTHIRHTCDHTEAKVNEPPVPLAAKTSSPRDFPVPKAQICSRCRSELHPTDKFCTECGYPVGGYPAKSWEEKEPRAYASLALPTEAEEIADRAASYFKGLRNQK